jgi:hypothetical protein
MYSIQGSVNTLSEMRRATGAFHRVGRAGSRGASALPAPPAPPPHTPRHACTPTPRTGAWWLLNPHLACTSSLHGTSAPAGTPCPAFSRAQRFLDTPHLPPPLPLPPWPLPPAGAQPGAVLRPGPFHVRRPAARRLVRMMMGRPVQRSQGRGFPVEHAPVRARRGASPSGWVRGISYPGACCRPFAGGRWPTARARWWSPTPLPRARRRSRRPSGATCSCATSTLPTPCGSRCLVGGVGGAGGGV